jgi:2-(3-amino-3-carboxypropyl)histidine synthase
MEADRLETNLGPTEDQNLEPEQVAVPKQPKRRFVGRKTADLLAQENAKDGGIEESSSSLQGKTQIFKIRNGD